MVYLSDNEIKEILSALLRSTPKPIHEFSNVGGFYYCPHCYSAVEIEYQKNCGCCGQKLKWYGHRKYAKCIDFKTADKNHKINLDVMEECRQFVRNGFRKK